MRPNTFNPLTELSRYSDIDVCVIFENDTMNNKSQKVSRLKMIVSQLYRWNLASKVQPIYNAAVPITKLSLNTYDVDISVNSAGLSAVTVWYQERMEAYPIIKDIALVLKSILFEQGLMNTHLGGISSTMIFFLILASIMVQSQWRLGMLAAV